MISTHNGESVTLIIAISLNKQSEGKLMKVYCYKKKDR